jgi:hypothetical protein
MTTAITTQQADHYIVEATYWAKTEIEKFENLHDAIGRAGDLIENHYSPVTVIAVFADGTRQVMA